MSAIFEADRVMQRTEFLVKIAHTLGVPVIGTEQNPSRMGGLAETLLPFLNEPAESKMTFSCSGCDLFRRYFVAGPLQQVVLVGIETHICVTQTANELLEIGHEVIVAADALSSRTPDRHEIGLKRLAASGAVAAHSESIAYEWMRSAEHPKFKEALEIVKAYP
jgi:hypothetical protein